ncbi:MAG: hypothetical protein HS113_10600 [Verrucomicrobiales bacterium]|nr:hypothetical protein [Verrucomicrobiales bacterium]
MRTLLVLSLTLSMLGVESCNSANAISSEGVLIRNSELWWCVLGPSPVELQLTFDGLPKSLPKWDERGLRAAYIATRLPLDSDCSVAYCGVWRYGQTNISLYPVFSVGSNEVQYVTSIADFWWVNNSVIAVVGHIHPSASALELLSADDGRILLSQVGLGFLISPDARHVVHFGEVPHFVSAESKRGSVVVDGKTVFGGELEPIAYEMISNLAASVTFSEVAFLARAREDPQHVEVVIADLSGVKNRFALPTLGEVRSGKVVFSGEGGGLIVVELGAEAWSVGGNLLTPKRLSRPSIERSRQVAPERVHRGLEENAQTSAVALRPKRAEAAE